MSLLFLSSAIAGFVGSLTSLILSGKSRNPNSVFSDSWIHVNERLGLVDKESPLNLSWPQVATLQFSILLFQPLIGSTLCFVILAFALLGDLHFFARFRKETCVFPPTILAYILLESFMLYSLL